MQIVTGTFDGTGAAINVGIGFIPKRLKLWNVTETTLPLSYAEWMREFAGLADRAQGTSMAFLNDGNGDALSYALGAGIAPYAGGVVGDNTEVYLIKDPHMNKCARGASDTEINLYTKYSGATGSLNAGFSTVAPNIVGIGSEIWIDSGTGAKQYYISTCTAPGTTAGHITLNATVPTGTITYLGGRFTHVQCPPTHTMPAGFTINFTTGAINTDSEMIAFIAYGDEYTE